MIEKKRKNIFKEKAIIVAINLRNSTNNSLDEEIQELLLLSDTAGANVIDIVIQNRNKIDPSTFLGSGKVKSIINNAKELNCSLIIFKDDLSPAQLKNIQQIAKEDIKIIDRSGLILDIFDKHAKTKEAKVQIKLARLKYFLPRLTKQWTHLERQMGGVGTRGGPGEAQIEIDRRLIRNQISHLTQELKKIQNQRSTQHKSRSNIYKVSLSGYTNSGKSTIMKSITNSKIYVQNQLFATLDTTTRKVENKKKYDFLLSDTVGFIRNLPHDLIASFRSTLMEIEESDLIIKVLDSSSDDIETHLATIEDVFKKLTISTNLELIVFNKIDLIDVIKLKQIKSKYPNAIFISAYKELKINELLDAIQNKLNTLNITSELHVPYDKFSVISDIYKSCNVLSETNKDSEVVFKVESSLNNIDKLKIKIKQS